MCVLYPPSSAPRGVEEQGLECMGEGRMREEGKRHRHKWYAADSLRVATRTLLLLRLPAVQLLLLPPHTLRPTTLLLLMHEEQEGGWETERRWVVRRRVCTPHLHPSVHTCFTLAHLHRDATHSSVQGIVQWSVSRVSVSAGECAVQRLSALPSVYSRVCRV